MNLSQPFPEVEEGFPRFITNQEITIQKEKNLYEILENSDLDSTYFKAICMEYGKEVVIHARDKRIGHQGRTLLHEAAYQGLVHAVSFLVKFGCQINSFDSSVSLITPLMESISMGHIDVSVILVSHGADLFIQDVNGENALHYCARNDSKLLTKSILVASSLTPLQIQECASTLNIKQKFPEDLAKPGSLCQLALKDWRERGSLSSESSKIVRFPYSKSTK